ncbi:MAG TPA: hypothetical protein VJU18_10225 [Vicinamibacteria bacterium]|nr:hypothetical protein [Vicinamibacteria bacterium]
MNFGSLVGLVGGVPYFDLPLLVQGSTEKREAIRVQLSRWMRDGKVLGLRRGMYALADAYRRAPVAPASLANQLYRPSCLSGLWALAYHDLIPERVVWLTSVTPRGPRRFENRFGVFDYRNLKQEAFFGYQCVRQRGHEFFVAEPEKALLDHWHLTPGEWTPERLAGMRYQSWARLSPERLRDWAHRFRSPRLERAARRFLELAAEDEKGTVVL